MSDFNSDMTPSDGGSSFWGANASNSGSSVTPASSRSASPPPKPKQGKQRAPLHLDLNHLDLNADRPGYASPSLSNPILTPNSVEASSIEGKTLVNIRRSPNHPCLTLYFDDESSYQVLVDGYQANGQGTHKFLELNAHLEALLADTAAHLPAPIERCAYSQLVDVAFCIDEAKCASAATTLGRRPSISTAPRQTWDQKHTALAFKLGGRLHIVSAQMEERVAEKTPYREDKDFDPTVVAYVENQCTFRNYCDVYLKAVTHTQTRSLGRARGGRLATRNNFASGSKGGSLSCSPKKESALSSASPTKRVFPMAPPAEPVTPKKREDGPSRSNSVKGSSKKRKGGHKRTSSQSSDSHWEKKARRNSQIF
ncbi:hypothetical protein GGG16DRAFT_126170 [Schizophyllum commune]